MKLYLFLYPIREYCERGVIGSALQGLGEKNCDPHRLGKIIHARYRARGYRVWWLLFSASSAVPYLPDYSHISPFVEFEEEDSFLASGVTFREHTRDKRYPNPKFIARKIPRKVKTIVLGGFHQWDCVSTLAEALYKSGAKVVVDEDTTEYFFIRTNLEGDIPLIRPLTDHVDELLQSYPDMTESILDRRIGKPWFVSPTVNPEKTEKVGTNT